MGATFVMSYPSAEFGRLGRRAAQAGAVDAEAAVKEWIVLADAVQAAGGRILVCEPPNAPAEGGPSVGASLPFAADWGVLIRRRDQPVFLLPRAVVPHRAGEADVVRAFFGRIGVEVQALALATAGRGDLVQIGPGRYLFAAGEGTDAEAASTIERELDGISRYLSAKVVAPFGSADEVLAMLHNKAGDAVLLCHEAGLSGRSIPELRNVFSKVDVIPVDADDAAAGACTSLCVDGTVLHPPGLSTALRSHMLRRGLQLVELDLPNLRAAGGGPHAYVNELVGFVLAPGTADYPRVRDTLQSGKGL